MNAPFPYFGGKRTIVDDVWKRLGSPKQYIEPFCGSAAVLLGSPSVASLEVVNDVNGFIANFWRCVSMQPAEVARHADYPVSHIDQAARHRWLMEQRPRLEAEMQDPLWPGDARVAGWWLWGQCSWIGSGWCEWSGKIPHVGNAGRGVQAAGQIPHVGNAGMGEMLTSSGEAALVALTALAKRLERVRVLHGSWDRCLNNHYGADNTAVFLDPPYRAYESLYGTGKHAVADDVEAWCRENQGAMRIALCGHVGDYPSLEGWECMRWTRTRNTYAGAGTKDLEAVWFSPTCLRVAETGQISMFSEGA